MRKPRRLIGIIFSTYDEVRSAIGPGAETLWSQAYESPSRQKEKTEMRKNSATETTAAVEVVVLAVLAVLVAPAVLVVLVEKFENTWKFENVKSIAGILELELLLI